MKALITGAGGMLAGAVARALRDGGHDVIALSRAELDVTEAARVGEAVAGVRPDVVVQCAAYTDVDGAESDEARAFEVNADGARRVAQACALAGARFVYPSTDYVFAGDASSPYPPDAPIHPINAYGRSKAAGEDAARAADSWLVVRTAWLYGDGGRNFVRTMIERARAIRDGSVDGPLRVVEDQRGAPTWTHTLADALVRLLDADVPSGVYHATCRGETTWYGLARAALRLAGLGEVAVEPVGSGAFPRAARRPAYSVLELEGTEGSTGPLPHWREALEEAVGRGRF